MGVRDAQLVDGDGPDDATVNGSDAPEPFSSGGGSRRGPDGRARTTSRSEHLVAPDAPVASGASGGVARPRVPWRS